MMLDPEDKDSFLAKGDPPAADAKSGSGRQRNTPPRVLVIDDESTIRMALRRFFGRMGWDVAEAPDGKQALDLLLKSAHPDAESKKRDPGSSEAYDMVLSDVRLKAERPDILPHLVFSTGDIASTETVEFVRDIGVPVIQKPFHFSLLKELAERMARESP
jgi:CheY-like chemotaxis protein